MLYCGRRSAVWDEFVWVVEKIMSDAAGKWDRSAASEIASRIELLFFDGFLVTFYQITDL